MLLQDRMEPISLAPRNVTNSVAMDHCRHHGLPAACTFRIYTGSPSVHSNGSLRRVYRRAMNCCCFAAKSYSPPSLTQAFVSATARWPVPYAETGSKSNHYYSYALTLGARVPLESGTLLCRKLNHWHQLVAVACAVRSYATQTWLLRLETGLGFLDVWEG